MSLRPRTPLLALTLVLLAAVPAAAEPPDPAPLTLRLPDLGPGYVMNDTGSSAADDACTRLVLSARGLSRTVHRIGRFPYRSCWMSFARAWTPPDTLPGPDYVDSIGFAFDDPQGAQALLAHPRAIPALLLSVAPRQLRVAEQVPEIGEEAVLLRLGGRGLLSVVIVVWRTGSTVGMIGATEIRGADANEESALRLAAVQQARIAAPTPLLASDFDDLEVPLDDPAIDVPIHWVGRDLDRRPRFPRVRLQTVEPLALPDRRAGLRAVLTYGPHEEVTAFRLVLFHPRAFARPALARELAVMRRDRCARVIRISLADGGATLYATKRGCRSRTLDGTIALVRLPGVRIVVEPVHGCAECTDVVTRWSSPAGVRAIVRALRIREPTAETLAPR